MWGARTKHTLNRFRTIKFSTYRYRIYDMTMRQVQLGLFSSCTSPFGAIQFKTSPCPGVLMLYRLSQCAICAHKTERQDVRNRACEWTWDPTWSINVLLEPVCRLLYSEEVCSTAAAQPAQLSAAQHNQHNSAQRSTAAAQQEVCRRIAKNARPATVSCTVRPTNPPLPQAPKQAPAQRNKLLS